MPDRDPSTLDAPASPLPQPSTKGQGAEIRERVAEALYEWWDRDEPGEEHESWRAIGQQGQTWFREGADAVLAVLDPPSHPRRCPSCDATHPVARFRVQPRCVDAWHDVEAAS